MTGDDGSLHPLQEAHSAHCPGSCSSTGRPVHIGSRAFDILELLIEARGTLVTKIRNHAPCMARNGGRGEHTPGSYVCAAQGTWLTKADAI